MRADSGFDDSRFIACCRRGGARFSVTARIDAAVSRVIALIPETAWQPIPYWDAVDDDDGVTVASSAEVAETVSTAFTSTKTPVTARLVVRRVRRLREAATGEPLDQQALDVAVWRHHALLTDRIEPLLAVEREHRAHAVVEQSTAELEQGPLAHLPSGDFWARTAFPQVRLVALAECGTRALIGATVGPYDTGEKTLTTGLLAHLDPTMLVLADRNFPGYELWRDAAGTGATLVWRVGASFCLPVEKVLPDGSYLSWLRVPKALRRSGGRDIAVRIVAYQLRDEHGAVTETFALGTTLLNPQAAPAAELAELYHSRWQIETALAALTSELRGNGVVLRSKTPDGAEQECWALLCAYHAIRDVLCAAATLTEQDPLRLPFINALDAVRGPVGDPAAFPP